MQRYRYGGWQGRCFVAEAEDGPDGPYEVAHVEANHR